MNLAISHPTQVSSTSIAESIAAGREAQVKWAREPVAKRLKIVCKFRHLIADHSPSLVACVNAPFRTHPAETLAAEILPIAEACRFLELTAVKSLANRRLPRTGRPLWLSGVDIDEQRDPWGVVLIITPSNYPLLLPAVHGLSALVAGNAIALKPAPGYAKPAERIAELWHAAGLDPALLLRLPEENESVAAAVDAGVDRVVLTGSAGAGRAIQNLLVESLTPATMELSGCDAVFVLESADLERVAGCLVFGLIFNQSATCIAPRRLFVPTAMQRTLESRLMAALDRFLAASPDSAATQWNPNMIEHRDRLVAEAIEAGARTIRDGAITILADCNGTMKITQSDLFVPTLSIIPVDNLERAIAINRSCPYALGASVFGEPREAVQWATRIDAGCVVVNDIIAPTADPRVAFGGRRKSGFGVTRGTAGLLEMTQPKSIIRQRSRWLPHLDPPTAETADILTGLLQVTHGQGLRRRLQAVWNLAMAAMKQRKEGQRNA